MIQVTRSVTRKGSASPNKATLGERSELAEDCLGKGWSSLMRALRPRSEVYIRKRKMRRLQPERRPSGPMKILWSVEGGAEAGAGLTCSLAEGSMDSFKGRSFCDGEYTQHRGG